MNPPRMPFSLIVVLLAALATPLASAAGKLSVDRVEFVPREVAPGETATLEIEVTVAPGWHIYGSKEEVGLVPSLRIDADSVAGRLERDGALAVPPGKPHPGALVSYWLEGTQILRQRFRVPDDAPPGTVDLAGSFRYMVCDPRQCLPPADEPIRASIEISAAGEGQATPDPVIGENRGHLKIRSVRWNPPRVNPGGTATLEIEVEPDFGWHFYGSMEDVGAPPSLEAELPAGVSLEGDLEVPPGVPHESYGQTSYWVAARSVLKQRFRVADDRAPGALPVSLAFTYIACNERMCDPPVEVPIEIALPVVAEPAAAEGASAPAAKADGVPAPFVGPSDGHLSIRSVRFEPERVAPGGATELLIEVEPDPGWHFYGRLEEIGEPPSIAVELPGDVVADGELWVPDGEPHETAGLTTYWVAEKTTLRQRYRVRGDAPSGARKVTGKLHYLACDEKMCDAPREIEFSAGFVVDPSAPDSERDTAAGVAVASGGGDESSGAEGEEGGLLLFLTTAFLAGLLALVMPCTYPMIPITISFFTKQANERGGSVLPLSLAYGAGIVGIFVVIGVALGPPIVWFATHPVTNLVIGILFVVFALSLFGLFYLQPPEFLMRGASAAGRRGGYVGVFLMGATLVVTSFTCTLPFVGSLLAVGARSGDYGRVALGMAVFGLTMAVPFVLLSLVPGMMQKIPKSGNWMTTLKVTLGFVELAAALKFFSNAELVWGLYVLPRELFLTVWTAIFLAMSLYLLGFVRLKGESGEIGPGRLVAGVVGLILTFATFYGSLGHPFQNLVMRALEPPYTAADLEGGGAGALGAEPASRDRHRIVVDDFDEAVRVARAENLALLVNFTGHT